MRQNANLTVTGQKVVLVPYRPEHVILYHHWMQDPYLQEATASDPLTLEEEYQMQKNWRDDDDKCTFILLDPQLPDTEGTGRHGGGMVGDVNLFLNDHEDRSAAEIEVMIAEPQARRKGIAWEALSLLMLYAVKELGIVKFVAKIGYDNLASQALFIRLGFTEVGRSEIFKEATLQLIVDSSVLTQLRERAGHFVVGTYDTE